MSGKGSRARACAERNQAKQAAYKYLNNPFPADSRIARFYEKAKMHKMQMDAMFDDFEEVYGSSGGTKKVMIDNIVGTFKDHNSKTTMKALNASTM